MFKQSTFVTRRRGGSQIILLQLVMLSVVFFACIIGVIAFIHFSSVRSDASTEIVEQQVVPLVGSTEVLVPTQTIPAGVELDSSMFRFERKPEKVVSPDAPRSFEDIRGLYTKGVLLANQPINLDYLTNLQPVNALTASIPPGYRAIAITVDATSSVEGWAQPGARVDVIWVTTFTGRRTASVIAPNAKVLSANRRVEGAAAPAARAISQPRAKKGEEGIPATVTLLLTSRDAMRVRLAALHGRLSLVLRGIDDSGMAGSTVPIGEGSLYSGLNHQESPRSRNLVTVTVKDRNTGEQESLVFENGQRVDSKQ
jgi:pilus assembly protein CpaB